MTKSLYIILTPSIGNMGGNQMYVNNKIKHLYKRGWEVCVLYYMLDNNIIIDNLKKFESNRVKELGYSIHIYTKKHRTRIVEEAISRMPRELPTYERIIIESNMFNLSYWGELIARRIGAFHTINPLEEHTPLPNRYLSRFLDFKLRRREVLNASEDSLRRFMGPYYKTEYSDFHFKMIPYASNVVEDITYDTTEFDDTSKKIMCIGRLDKPYVIPIMEDLAHYLLQHPQTKFSIIFIGASPTGKEENEIKQFFIDLSNVKLHFLGYMLPIPKKLIKIADTVIATANSVKVGANEGVPTISIDPKDFKPLGVYGHTTSNINFRKEEPVVEISTILDNILFDGIYVKTEEIEDASEANRIFENQISYVINSAEAKTKEYFDVISIFPYHKRIASNIKRIIRSKLINTSNHESSVV